jgi:hypothetical protein
MFTAWYLNQVISDESRVFKPDYLRFYDADSDYHPDEDECASLEVHGGSLDGSIEPVRCTIHVDPATTVGADSNFSGIAVVLTASGDRYFVHESWKGKEAPAALIKRMTDLCVLYRPQALSIDVLGQQVLWLDPLKDSLKKAGVVVQISPYKGKTHDEKVGKGILGKAKRIEALEPLFRDGRIFIRRGYNAALLHEYNFYDGPTHRNHFDLLDALAHLRTMTRKPDAQHFRDNLEKLEMQELEDIGDRYEEKKKVAGIWAGR